MNKLLVISSYPPKGTLHGNKYSAVASYTKNTLNSIDKASNKKIEYLVLADILDKSEEYKEDNKKVLDVGVGMIYGFILSCY